MRHFFAKSFFAGVVGLFLLFCSFRLAAPYWVWSKVEDWLKVDVEGVLRPELLKQAFSVEKAQIRWKDRLEADIKVVRVEYSFANYWKKRTVRIRVQAEEAPVKLLGEWADIQNAQDIKAQELIADIEIGPNGISDVRELRLNSPSLTFDIKS